MNTLDALISALVAASRAADEHAAKVRDDDRAAELTTYVVQHLGEVRRIARILAAHHAEAHGHATHAARASRG